MLSIEQLITFTFQNEHGFEHDLENDLTKKKIFTPPKIYSANGDLSKRWFIYFSYRNPETGKLERSSNIYANANTFKTKEDRLTVLVKYRERLLFFLEQGYNPFEDNSELFQKTTAQEKPIETLSENISILPKYTIEEFKKMQQQATSNKVVAKVVDADKVTDNKGFDAIATKEQQHFQQLTTTKTKDVASQTNEEFADKVQDEQKGMGFTEAFEFALSLKAKVVKETTINDYRGKSEKLTTWLLENKKEKTKIHQLKRQDLLDFLNSILKKTSPRTTNNYRVDLSSLFQVLKNNEIVSENYLTSIPVIKTKPKRHKKYSIVQQKDIFKYLEKKDPMLLLYIKFMSYVFVRPIEINRLKIKDVDLKNKTIQFQSKTKNSKTKILPEILLKELPDLSGLDPDLFLFTPNAIGGTWEAKDENRREHFSNRFKSVVKDHFKLDENYTLYSFRHTFITKLLSKLKKKYSPNEAKNKLMLITGHDSREALEKYLRDIDADLPEDYSDLFK